MSGDVTAAIERLRGDVSDKGVLTKKWPSIARDTRTLLAEVERLRAEREALHSDEMARKVHAAVVDAIRSKFLVNHRDGAINSMGLSETVAHAVVRVLRDDSEADQ